MIIKSIREALDGRPVLTVGPDTTLEDASAKMQSGKSDVLVVLGDGRLVGTLTEADVIRHVSQHGGFTRTLVADVMVKSETCVETRESLWHALCQLRESGHPQIPVIDLGQHVVGLLSEADIPVEYRMKHARSERWSFGAAA